MFIDFKNKQFSYDIWQITHEMQISNFFSSTKNFIGSGIASDSFLCYVQNPSSLVKIFNNIDTKAFVSLSRPISAAVFFV